MKRLEIVTSGRDAPGMNAVIRADVRTAIPCGFKVLGIKRGNVGLLNNEIQYLDLDTLGNRVLKPRIVQSLVIIGACE